MCKEASKRFREKNIAEGRCRCGGVRVEDLKSCQDCLDSNRKMSSKTYKQRKARGLCTCGRPKEEGKSCLHCLPRTYQWRVDRRKKAVALLGTECVCCGETFLGFLEVDHVHNDGAEERKELPTAKLYNAICKGKVALSRYQLLCSNCNGRKFRSGLGICDHPDHKMIRLRTSG